MNPKARSCRSIWAIHRNALRVWIRFPDYSTDWDAAECCKEKMREYVMKYAKARGWI
jgi:hypothetical protein